MMTSQDAKDILERSIVHCGADHIDARIRHMGEIITKNLRYENPLVVLVMKGSFMFGGDLLKNLPFPLEVDCITVKSFSGTWDHPQKPEPATTPIVMGIMPEVANRTVLLVDDVLDTGHSLEHLARRFKHRGAKAVETAVLCTKQISSFPCDYIGMTVPDKFIFGFGMDISGYWRNLSEIRYIP